jgi:AraC-like DNA-binding protein
MDKTNRLIQKNHEKNINTIIYSCSYSDGFSFLQQSTRKQGVDPHRTEYRQLAGKFSGT